MSERYQSDVQRTAAYYDGIADQYDSQVDSLALNRAMRTAFRSRVSALVGPGGTILDFGCGTGTDAIWYVGQGHRVVAYDISAGMVSELRVRCPEAVAGGRIIPVAGSLQDLMRQLQNLPPVDGIAANFAVLNHVDDLAPLLALLAPRLVNGGSLVASLLNPLYGMDLRRRSWWRVTLLSVRTGSIVLRGAVTTYRHFIRTVRRRSRPHFSLVEVAHADAAGNWSTAKRGWRTAPQMEFFFAVLRKTE
jgi:SAM-dependent methyltransferase